MYDVIISVYGYLVTQIIDMVMWPKIGNSASVFIRKAIKSSISISSFDFIKTWLEKQKNIFLVGWSWFNFNNLQPVLVTALKFQFYSSVATWLKLKVTKFEKVVK